MSKKHPRRPARWQLLQKPGPGARVIGCIRVSTDMQKDKYSLPEQQRRIEELCTGEGRVMVGWCIEPGVSAKDDFDSRPEWKRLIFERAGKECDVIVCHDYKRWCRNQAYDILSLEELRRRGVWWQTVDDGIDINHDQESGKDVVMGVNRVMKAAYVRELAREVHKGKEGTARKGFSNGYPNFGYRYPTITLEHGERPPTIVYEPHPTYFEVVQELGRLAASTPVLSCGEIARRLNRVGYRYAPHRKQEVEVPFTGETVWLLLGRRFYRAFSPGSDRGTIVTPEGIEVEGQHLAVWDYDLCQQIDRNRAAMRQIYGATGIHSYARVREAITFAGLLVCAHCGSHLVAHYASKATSSGTFERMYYRCRARNQALECETANVSRLNRGSSKVRGFTSMREDVLDAQMGELLVRLGGFADQARVIMQREHEEQLLASSEPVTPPVDYEKLRRSLEEQRRRTVKAWIKGELTEDEKDDILVDLDRQRADIPDVDQLRAPAEVGLAAISAVESLGDLWRATEYLSRERCASARHSALLKLFRPFGIYCDTIRYQIVGVRPQPDCFHAIAVMLKRYGWYEREAGLLWSDAPGLPQPEATPSLIERIYRALDNGFATAQEITAVLHHTNFDFVSAKLRLAWRYGLLARTCGSIPGKSGYFYRYELRSTYDEWRGQEWHPWRHVRGKKPDLR